MISSNIYLDEILIKSTQGKKAVAAIYRLKHSKKRLSFKTRESLKVEEQDLVSKLISAPTDFTHVSHMGPGSGLQMLHDIPTQAKVRRSRIIFSSDPNLFSARLL